MSNHPPLIKIIDRQALCNNWRQIRRRSAARRLLAVIKSNAYGHGLAQVAEALENQADGFAVVRLQDAVALRRQGIRKPLVLLQGIFAAEETRLLTDHQLTPVVHSGWQLQALATLPANAGLTVYLKFNSGMNRLGFPLHEADAVIAALRQLPAVKEVLLMSHFANADTPNGLKAPLEALAALRAHRLALSLGNSAASLLHGNIGDDCGRIGIALYGASPAPAWHRYDALGLQPVMTWQTTLIAVQTVAANAAVGYGGEYTANAPMRIGVASVGYGDGYPRCSGMTAVIHNQKTPLVGRVSMEMINLDLGACPAAKIGDTVTLWGEYPHIDETADAANTIAYDLLTRAKGAVVFK